jgi:HEAT repeat protein
MTDDDLDKLIEDLEDEDEEVREAAAKALGKIGGERAVEPLIKALEDGEWEVRLATAEALIAIDDTRAVEPLITVLEDEDGDVRSAAADALGQIGDTRAVEPLIKSLSCCCGRRDRIYEGPPAGTEFCDCFVRSSAAEALGKIGDARAVSPLIDTFQAEVFQEEDVNVREAAAEALRNIVVQGLQGLITPEKKEELTVSFIKALGDDDEWVRIDAAEALDEIGAGRAVEHFIGVLSESDDWCFREAAAEALGKIGDVRAVEPLIKALTDEDEEVCDAAKEALKKLGHEVE